tara:strand:- start:2349 stop:3512 length:1164 start_codon:yes stop_codon:yes gene_type:complete
MGVGGADALMMGLMRYTENVDWTGVCVERPLTRDMWEWTDKYVGDVPIHTSVRPNEPMFNDVHYHPNIATATFQACKDADIILVWCVEQLHDGALATMNKPIIELTQNTDDHAKRQTALIDHLVDYRVACCKAAIETYPKKRRETVKVIPNAIDPNRVVPRYGREHARRAWGVTEDEKVMLFMGRTVDEKNPQALIQALSHLPENWKAMFVGAGYRDDDLYSEAQRYVKDPDRVLFMDSQFHVGDILAAADVYCLPSDFEGQPLALCEAWLAGIPTVCSEFTNAVDLREQFGALCTYIPRAPTGEQMAEAVLRATSGTEEVMMECVSAREVVWQNFTLPTVAVAWEDFMERALFDWRQKRRLATVHPVQPRIPRETSTSKVQIIKGA